MGLSDGVDIPCGERLRSAAGRPGDTALPRSVCVGGASANIVIIRMPTLLPLGDAEPFTYVFELDAVSWLCPGGRVVGRSPTKWALRARIWTKSHAIDRLGTLKQNQRPRENLRRWHQFGSECEP